MIIKDSQVSLYAEHEKRESSLITQVVDSELKRMSFNSELERIGFSIQNTSAAMQVQAEPEKQQESLLVMTEEGLQFRQSTAVDDDALQVQLTKSQLFQLLLEAINQRKTDFGGSPIKLPSEGGEEVREGYIPSVQKKPVTLELSFQVKEQIEEYECSSFSSCGNVKTADGREIDFSLSLQMERSYSATREYTLEKQVQLTDPLVINFSGESVALSDETFSFDLDADGDRELINYLSSNSAFLSLDHNQDGLINDGGELFGALSGNGFNDLSEFDEDGNYYIDEADSVFSDLKLWQPNADGDSIVSLAEAGIGAIYLGSTETPFSLKNDLNEQKGQVRSSGVYLSESGEVGSIQQIDMAV